MSSNLESQVKVRVKSISLLVLFYRIPQFMLPMGLTFFVMLVIHDIRFAGIAGSSVAFGTAISAIFFSEIFDKFNPRWVIRIFAIVFSISSILLFIGFNHLAKAGIIATSIGVKVGIVVAALIVGAFIPQMATAVKMIWTRVLPYGHERDIALSFDALSLDIAYTFAPVLASFITTSTKPTLILVIIPIAIFVACIIFSFIPSLGLISTKSHAANAVSRDLYFPNTVKALLFNQFAFLICLGVIETMVQRATQLIGQPRWGGIFLGLWAASSVLATFVLVKIVPKRIALTTKYSVSNFLIGTFTMIILVALFVNNINLKLFIIGFFLFISGLFYGYNGVVTFNILDNQYDSHIPAKVISWWLGFTSFGYAFGLLSSGILGNILGPYWLIFIAGLVLNILGYMIYSRRTKFKT